MFLEIFSRIKLQKMIFTGVLKTNFPIFPKEECSSKQFEEGKLLWSIWAHGAPIGMKSRLQTEPRISRFSLSLTCNAQNLYQFCTFKTVFKPMFRTHKSPGTVIGWVDVFFHILSLFSSQSHQKVKSCSESLQPKISHGCFCIVAFLPMNCSKKGGLSGWHKAERRAIWCPRRGTQIHIHSSFFRLLRRAMSPRNQCQRRERKNDCPRRGARFSIEISYFETEDHDERVWLVWRRRHRWTSLGEKGAESDLRVIPWIFRRMNDELSLYRKQKTWNREKNEANTEIRDATSSCCLLVFWSKPFGPLLLFQELDMRSVICSIFIPWLLIIKTSLMLPWS